MDDAKWKDFYSSNRDNVSKIFIKVMTSDGQHFFFSDYDQWYKVKDRCEKENVIIEDLHLQFRTNKHIVDVSDCDGIYLVRSALGQIGQPTKNYFTIGLLKSDKVYKQMWLTPELILEQEFIDDLSGCFEEALIRYGKERKIREE
jgi:tRNA-dihydrouridine synthase